MRLLIFSPFYPPHKGGLESHSDEFNKYLSRQGIKIHVFTPRLPLSSPEKETRYDNVSITRFPAFELIHNYPLPKFWQRNFWRLWKDLDCSSYDIVVSRTRFFFTSLMAWRAAKKKLLPLVHIEHGSDFTYFHSRIKTWLGKLYDYTAGSFVLRRSQHIIANSQASANFVKDLSGGRNCRVFYRGVEQEMLSHIAPDESLRKKYGQKVMVGFIGRLIDGKGVADLIEAFSQLHDDNSVCCIIGNGPEKERLEAMIIKHRLSEKVLLLGEKSFPEAMALLKTFDIFVNPSYTEGIPTSVIEAALCEKAIIATKVGGTQEIITGEDDGFLIAPHDIAALRDKMEQLIKNSNLRKTLGHNAFMAVRERFSWQKTATAYIDFFNAILNQKY